MGSLAELLLTLLDLVEAEGKALRAGTVRLATSVAVVLLGAVLALAGLGLIVWAIYLYFRISLSPPTSALLDGFLFLIIAGGMLWAARRLSH